MSSGLLSWAGKGISLLQLGYHKGLSPFSDRQCCRPLLFLPHRCWHLSDPSVSYSEVTGKQIWLGL